MTPSHVALGELTKIRTGKLDANASSPNGEFPFFTCASEPLRIASYSYDCECVLVAGNGDLNVKYYEGKFDAYQRTYIIETADPEKLNTRYLYYFMDSYLSSLREQSIGGIIKYIKIGNLTGAQIPLPPLPEQRRIAAILDKADALRAKRREAIAKLDLLLQSVFLEMFGDPAKNPKGWKVVKSGSLFAEKPRIGTTKPATGDGYLVVRVGELGAYRIELEKSSRVVLDNEVMKKFLLRTGDIVLARAIGSKDQLGKCSYFPGNSEPVCIDSHVMRLRPNPEKVEPAWLYSLISSDSGKRILQRKGGATAVQFNINAAQASDLDIPVPPLAMQKEFVYIADKIRAQLDSYREASQKVASLFEALQDASFAGAI
ncbi:restriction endonuclease subunit S [Stutzerimonas zhaodongensis]|uniref:restriction endonuclease subunit S n=1 Tax=Stutzerimonas TaxID=2901164 RepID=UPI00388F6A0F